MLTQHIELARVAPALQLSKWTLYGYHSRGRLPWLTRAPAGTGGVCRLRVDWPSACDWFAARGVDLQDAATATLPIETCRLLGIGSESTK